MASTSGTARTSRAAPGARIAGRPRKALLTLHIVTAVGLIGEAAALSALGFAGLGGADPETIYPAMHLIAMAVLAPLVTITLVVGITQALLLGYGLFSRGWIVTKLVIAAALTGAAFGLVIPGLGRAADAATTAGESVTDVQHVVAAVTPTVALLLFVVAATLGVFRPERRRPSAAPVAGSGEPNSDARLTT